MFKFQKEQEIVNIAGVKIGGQPGELPTVLAGTIFYNKHEIVEDAAKGLFDRAAAEKLVNLQETGSEETGNPHIVHIFGTTRKSITRYIDFVTEISEAPFLIDSPEGAVRAYAAEYVSEVGLADKAIYNSINMSINCFGNRGSHFIRYRQFDYSWLQCNGLIASGQDGTAGKRSRPSGRRAPFNSRQLRDS